MLTTGQQRRHVLGVTTIQQGSPGGGPAGNVPSTEFLYLAHVAHTNRHSNRVHMASGWWYTLPEPDMRRFEEAMHEYYKGQP